MKRYRAPNFTTAELSHLLKLVENHPIIENKKTDGATIRAKQEAWQKLGAEYNSETMNCPRTVENLISCYKNQKSKSKKMHSNEKMAIKAPLPLQETVEEHEQDWAIAQATQESTSSTISMTNSDECQFSFNKLLKVKKEENHLEKAIDYTGGDPPQSCNSDPVHEKMRSLISPALEEDYTIFNRNSDFMAEQKASIPIDAPIDPLERPMDSTQNIQKGNKKNVSHSYQEELADDKKELAKAQRILVGLQVEREKLEIELAKEKLAFENKKNEMTLDFLDEKYKLELRILKNKTI